MLFCIKCLNLGFRNFRPFFKECTFSSCNLLAVLMVTCLVFALLTFRDQGVKVLAEPLFFDIVSANHPNLCGNCAFRLQVRRNYSIFLIVYL